MMIYGAIEAKKENCVGCRMCEIVCSASKEGEFIPSLSRIQVTEEPLRGVSAPIVCRQCIDPICMRVCPVSAIRERIDKNGYRWVDIDPKECISCGRCAATCPVGAINFSPRTKARKCDLCGGNPVCTTFCYYDCLRFVTEETPDLRKRAQKIDREMNRICRDLYAREIEGRHKSTLE